MSSHEEHLNMPQHGTGLLGEDLPLHAGQFPEPPAHGPPLAELVHEPAHLADALHKLAAAFELHTRELDIVESVGFAFDGNGNTAKTLGSPGVVLYEVPQGMIAYLTRVVIEVAGFSPAAPYAAAGAWAGIFREGSTQQVGGLLDFGPQSAGSALFPALFEAGSVDTAPAQRGPTRFILSVAGTVALANLQAVVSIRGVLRRQKG